MGRREEGGCEHRRIALTPIHQRRRTNHKRRGGCRVKRHEIEIAGVNSQCGNVRADVDRGQNEVIGWYDRDP